IVATDSATRRGSSVSSGAGFPVAIWQKSHRLVHWSPPMRKVASRSSQHSKMLGQPASSQTVCKPSRLTRLFSSVYAGRVRSRVLIHGGLRSMGVWLLRASRRSSLRPSGASTTPPAYVPPAEAPTRVPHAPRAVTAPGPTWLSVNVFALARAKTFTDNTYPQVRDPRRRAAGWGGGSTGTGGGASKVA